MGKNVKDEIKEMMKPKEMTFNEKLKEDKNFLLSLIDDPVKAFRAYGYNGDERMMGMMNTMSSNIRERAALIFAEIGSLTDESAGCEGCDGCRTCKGCSALEMPR